jgi:hypothetical protein
LQKQAATRSDFGNAGTDRILIWALQLKFVEIVSQCREQTGGSTIGAVFAVKEEIPGNRYGRLAESRETLEYTDSAHRVTWG